MPTPILQLEVDSAELVHVFLSADTGLTAQISTRLYGDPGLPQNFTIAKAVMFLEDGGPSHPDIPMAGTRFAFYCYGPTAQDARTVYRALFNALTRASRTNKTLTGGIVGRLQKATREGGPSSRTDPGTGWKYVWCAFRILYCEEDLS